MSHAAVGKKQLDKRRGENTSDSDVVRTTQPSAATQLFKKSTKEEKIGGRKTKTVSVALKASDPALHAGRATARNAEKTGAAAEHEDASAQPYEANQITKD